MALDLLGDGFDLHGGGQDLAFPHHENERAQAVAAGCAFARHWAHSGMVVAEGGEKMSKSLGNTLSLLELLDAHDPRAFRLQVLQSHYRSPMTVAASTLAAAEAGVERLDAFAREFAGARGAAPDPEALRPVPRAHGRRSRHARRGRRRLRAAPRKPDRRTGRAGRSSLAAAVFSIFEDALGLPLRG